MSERYRDDVLDFDELKRKHDEYKSRQRLKNLEHNRQARQDSARRGPAPDGADDVQRVPARRRPYIRRETPAEEETVSAAEEIVSGAADEAAAEPRKAAEPEEAARRARRERTEEDEAAVEEMKEFLRGLAKEMDEKEDEAASEAPEEDVPAKQDTKPAETAEKPAEQPAPAAEKETEKADEPPEEEDDLGEDEEEAGGLFGGKLKGIWKDNPFGGIAEAVTPFLKKAVDGIRKKRGALEAEEEQEDNELDDDLIDLGDGDDAEASLSPAGEENGGTAEAEEGAEGEETAGDEDAGEDEEEPAGLFKGLLGRLRFPRRDGGEEAGEDDEEPEDAEYAETDTEDAAEDEGEVEDDRPVRTKKRGFSIFRRPGSGDGEDEEDEEGGEEDEPEVAEEEDAGYDGDPGEDEEDARPPRKGGSPFRNLIGKLKRRRETDAYDDDSDELFAPEEDGGEPRNEVNDGADEDVPFVSRRERRRKTEGEVNLENLNENALNAEISAENEAAEMGLSRKERRELALKKKAEEEAARAAEAAAAEAKAEEEPAQTEPAAQQEDLFDQASAPADDSPADNSTQKIREQIISSREDEPEKVAGSIFDDSSIDGLEQMGTDTPQNPTRKYTLVHENGDEGDAARADEEDDLEETKTSLFGRKKSKAAQKADDEEDEEPKKSRRRSRSDEDEEEDDEEFRPSRRRRRRRDEDEEEEDEELRPSRRRRRGEDEDDDEDPEDDIDYDDYDYDDDDGAGHGFAYHLSGVFKVICIIVILILVVVLGLNVWDYVGNRQGKSSPVDALRDSVRSYAPGVFDVIFPLQADAAEASEKPADEAVGADTDADAGDEADAQNVG